MFEKKRKELVGSLVSQGYLRSPEIKSAFDNVPREDFVPEKSRDRAYVDYPLQIGQGQTISAPSMIAIMLEVIDIGSGQKVLEIGTGSGYNAALMAEVVGKEGKVYSMERIQGVAEMGKRNLQKTGYENIEVIVGDGTRGYEEVAPWDRILVTACAPDVPEPLVKQLKVGGKMAAPVGKHYMSQTLLVAEKMGDGKVDIEEHGRCAFVPLVGEYGWDEGEARY